MIYSVLTTNFIYKLDFCSYNCKKTTKNEELQSGAMRIAPGAPKWMYLDLRQFDTSSNNVQDHVINHQTYTETDSLSNIVPGEVQAKQARDSLLAASNTASQIAH